MSQSLNLESQGGSMILRVYHSGNDIWRDENGVKYETLPALPSAGIRASSPKARGILNQDASVIIQGNGKMGKMEDTIRAMQKRLNDLQQQQ